MKDALVVGVIAFTLAVLLDLIFSVGFPIWTWVVAGVAAGLLIGWFKTIGGRS